MSSFRTRHKIPTIKPKQKFALSQRCTLIPQERRARNSLFMLRRLYAIRPENKLDIGIAIEIKNGNLKMHICHTKCNGKPATISFVNSNNVPRKKPKNEKRQIPNKKGINNSLKRYTSSKRKVDIFFIFA